jgi:hypothetical protein
VETVEKNNLLTRVLHTRTTNNQTLVRLESADGSVRELMLTADAVSQLMAALVRATALLHREGIVQYAPIYTVTDCLMLTTEQQHGVVLETQEGFDISLALDNPYIRATLRACLEQIEHPIPGAESLH